MSNDLSELKERLNVCDTETAALAMAAKTFVLGNVDAKSVPAKRIDEWDCHIRVKAPVPVSLRSKAGMIANEIRSTLDGLACVLAERNGKTTGGVYFPISKSPEIFADDGMNKIKKLAQDDQDTIIALKPFRTGNEILWQLHEADRIRKHTKLLACRGNKNIIRIGAVHIEMRNVSIKNCNFGTGMIREMYVHANNALRAEIGEWFPIMTQIPKHLSFTVDFGVYYAEPEALAGKDLIDSLQSFSGEARRIIGLFEPPTSP